MVTKLDAAVAFPCRVDGWLNVWEVDYHQQMVMFEMGRSPLPIWEPHFCVLTQDNKRLAHYRNEKALEERGFRREMARLRLDGGKRDFDKRWGYETLESIKENVLQHSPLGLDGYRSQTLDHRNLSRTRDSAYQAELGPRRSSVPAVVPSTVTDDTPDDVIMDVPSTPSRIASFFSRKVIKSNLKRTKSVTKLDRKRLGSSNELEGVGKRTTPGSLTRTMSLGRLTKRWQQRQKAAGQPCTGSHPHPSADGVTWGALINSRIRASRSHESLLMSPSSMNSIDLTAPDVEIKPLHSSLLGQDHCFQVSTSNGTKYYSCRSAQERQRWIQHLRKTVQPDQEKVRRTDNALQIWIQEAKNVAPKKRYFCELCLDKTIYARTSSKPRGDMLFWGEQFDFNNLPDVEAIIINIYREADRKKKKEKNVLLGYVKIDTSEVNSRHMVERWYTARSAVVGKAGKDNKGDLPLMRIKARYQTVHILPSAAYQDLVQYVENDYLRLVEALEPVISVKGKEEVATCLVRVMQKLEKAQTFLPDIIIAEINKIENENLAFRGNSIATKAMEGYMKLVGEKYLQDTLSDFIRTVLESTEDCEVDPMRITVPGSLQRNQGNLKMYCEMVWFKIINSHCFFPLELKQVFYSLQNRCRGYKQEDMSSNLISACIFLRFLCPAILSPSLFNLVNEFPNAQAVRKLTLIAKTIQSLANFSKFGSKEEFMTFMNEFVEREMSSMNTFVQQISTVGNKEHYLEFDGYVDLGKELSTLHSLLTESIRAMPQASKEKLSDLGDICEEITECLADPNKLVLPRVADPPPGTPPRVYDNMSDSVPTQPQFTLGDGDQNANQTDVYVDLVKPVAATPQSGVMTMPRMGSSQPEGSIRPGNSSSTPRPHRQQEDYVSFTTIGHCVDERLAPSQSTPSARPDAAKVNKSWNHLVTAAEMVNGDHVDLISFADDALEHEVQNSSVELDNGDELSVGQVSTVASSGYQSFGYSQSNSPVEPLAHVDRAHNTPSQQPLSFSNPIFGHRHDVSRMCRTPSTSSLSSDDGSKRSQRLVNGDSKHVASAGSHGRTFSCSSSSSESLSHMDRRRRDGVPNMSSGSATNSPHTRHRPASPGPSHYIASPHTMHRVGSPAQSQFTSMSLAIHNLSKSAELPTFDSDSPLSVKRTMADSLMSTPDQPTKTRMHYATTPVRQSGNKGSHPPHAVRMGVRSVQRGKQDQKTTAEYEQELTLMRQELAKTQRELADTHQRLQLESQQRLNLETQVRETCQPCVEEKAHHVCVHRETPPPLLLEALPQQVAVIHQKPLSLRSSLHIETEAVPGSTVNTTNYHQQAMASSVHPQQATVALNVHALQPKIGHVQATSGSVHNQQPSVGSVHVQQASPDSVHHRQPTPGNVHVQQATFSNVHPQQCTPGSVQVCKPQPFEHHINLSQELSTTIELPGTSQTSNVNGQLQLQPPLPTTHIHQEEEEVQQILSKLNVEENTQGQERLAAVDSANSRLYNALSNLRDIGSTNGLSSPSRARLTLSDSSQLKSSSC